MKKFIVVSAFLMLSTAYVFSQNPLMAVAFGVEDSASANNAATREALATRAVALEAHIARLESDAAAAVAFLPPQGAAAVVARQKPKPKIAAPSNTIPAPISTPVVPSPAVPVPVAVTPAPPAPAVPAPAPVSATVVATPPEPITASTITITTQTDDASRRGRRHGGDNEDDD